MCTSNICAKDFPLFYMPLDAQRQKALKIAAEMSWDQSALGIIRKVRFRVGYFDIGHQV